MNENEFELDGKVYVASKAVTHTSRNPCYGCTFRIDDRSLCCCWLNGLDDDCAPSCDADFRADNMHVIFMEKPQ